MLEGNRREASREKVEIGGNERRILQAKNDGYPRNGNRKKESEESLLRN